jgi:hypothetical protein
LGPLFRLDTTSAENVPEAVEAVRSSAQRCKSAHRIAAHEAPGQTFGANTVTEEIHKRWGTKLRRRVDPRTVSATLRHPPPLGRRRPNPLHPGGRAHYEGLYVKGA